MKKLDRRRFLVAAATVSPLLASPMTAAGASAEARRLGFIHLHTGERLSIEYFGNGQYHPEALDELNHLLRDFRSGETGNMDPMLLDLLHHLQTLTGSRQPFEIISAFRSAATNAQLHRRSSGVASASLHMVGQAIDIRLADVPLQQLRDAALSLRAGGVGYYAASNFVHVDTGRVRAW